MIKAIVNDLEQVSNKTKSDILSHFFKTGKGEYAEGDIMIGITVPNSRLIAKKYFKLINYDDIHKLLSSKIHEYRLTALLILVEKFSKMKDESEKKILIEFYLKNTKYINNWDLVDLSCYKILGVWLLDKNKDILFTLAKSSDLWEQRISIVSCMHFIRNEEYNTFIKIAETLLNHPHHLIHKAIGWLLREMGKRNIEIEKAFLKKHYKNMPRTCLRYSIERFPEDERQKYLKGLI